MRLEEKKKRPWKSLSRAKRLSFRLRKLRTVKAEEKRAILVNHCLKMEALGPRQGQAKMRIAATMYDPQVKEYHRVPGKYVNLLIDSPEALEEAFEVMEEALKAWARGRWTRGKFQCPHGHLI